MKGFADVFRLPPPAKQPCELVAILERVVALISARPDAGGIAWRWELDAPAIRVSADPAQLEQAILNVVKNAVEAIAGDGTGGTVTIRVTSKTDPPTLVVEDSGAGLTAEAQANLFTPFFSTKPGGQGIGLTLVGEILAGHGFDYALERTAREHHRLPDHVHSTRNVTPVHVLTRRGRSSACRARRTCRPARRR